MLELPTDTGVGLGLSLFATSLVVMPAGIVMTLVSPASGRVARSFGPRKLFIAGTAILTAAYVFTIMFQSHVWQIVCANILIGIGIGFSYSAIPMLILRSVSRGQTGASNGVNDCFAHLATSVLQP